MSLLRLALLSLLAFSVACSEIPVLDSRGTPCGGTRQVDAEAVFPDTGLGAGGRATVSFYESDPNRSLDETAIIVWTFPPANTTFTDNPPRVRVLTDGGKVFLDLPPSFKGYRNRIAGLTPSRPLSFLAVLVRLELVG